MSSVGANSRLAQLRFMLDGLEIEALSVNSYAGSLVKTIWDWSHDRAGRYSLPK